MAELQAELVDQPAGLAALTGPWGELAVANRRPLSHPAWALGWLEHLAPATAAVRVAVVRERGRVIGLAPMFVEEGRAGRVDYRFIGAPLPRLTPLAVPGREWEVSRALAGVLSAATPAPDLIALEAHPLVSQWPRALAHAWPGRVAPWRVQYLIQHAPVTTLGMASFEDWLANRDPKFRSEVRRRRRRLTAAGGQVRVATLNTLERDIDVLLKLHRGRWASRGRSDIVAHESGVRSLFTQVGRALLDQGLFRLLLVEVDGQPIAAQVNAAAGGEVMAINGGWDEAYANLSPSVLCLLASIEDAIGRGERRFDLGPGTQPYKLRMADGDDPVAWTILIPAGRRLPLTTARTVPMLAHRRVRNLAKRAIRPEHQDRIRAARARLAGPR